MFVGLVSLANLKVSPICLLPSWTIPCLHGQLNESPTASPYNLIFFEIVDTEKDPRGWGGTLSAINPCFKACGLQPFFGL